VPADSRRFLYIIRSVSDAARRYVGLTQNVPARIEAHNAGQNPSTALWRPWTLAVCIEFSDPVLARRFERYLKSGSGHSFARRHFEAQHR
jgi:putative endonuclease